MRGGVLAVVVYRLVAGDDEELSCATEASDSIG
jgi:hypothetical protein